MFSSCVPTTMHVAALHTNKPTLPCREGWFAREGVFASRGQSSFNERRGVPFARRGAVFLDDRPDCKKRRLSVSRRWRRKRTFLPATRRSSDWMNMYLVPPKCTPPACSSEGSSMPATIFWTSSGETCAGGRMRRQISSRVQRIQNIQRSSTRRRGRTSNPAEAAQSEPSTPQIAPCVTCPVPIKWSST